MQWREFHLKNFLFERINSIKNLQCNKTPSSYDFGADLIVKSENTETIAIIQCKHRSSKEITISEKVITEELLKAKENYKYENPILILLSNVSNVTAGCKQAAKEYKVKLFLREKLENFDQEIVKIMD